MSHPIIIGVGDFKNKTNAVPGDGSDHPAQLMLHAIEIAVQDSGLSASKAKELQASIDSIDVVRPWSWEYPDAAAWLEEKLKVKAEHKFVTPHGGNQPAKRLDEAARRISQGKTKTAVVTGGEAIHSLMQYIGKEKYPVPGWPKSDVTPLAAGGLRPPSERNLKGIYEVGAPIQIYPLYENGYRAHYGQTYHQNNEESAKLYEEFDKVSAHNPESWNYGRPEKTKEEIGTISRKNRMICLPYPLLMNAFNNVNIAGACILTSTAYAEQLGIPKSKWIYALGGAGISESEDFWFRTNFYSSPAISYSIDEGLKASGLTKDQIDVLDFYSCFPIVPKVACRHLGLPTTSQAKPVTLLGGLTSFGGAGNNYSMHAITEMTRLLRQGKGKTGLVLANGGVMSYQHVLCLSSQPRRSGQYPQKAPLPEHVSDVPVPEFVEKAEGDATIETYTVEYNRDGIPYRGHIVGRLKKNDHRFLAHHSDERTLKELCRTDQEVVGRSGLVKSDPEEPDRNLFSFVTSNARL